MDPALYPLPLTAGSINERALRQYKFEGEGNLIDLSSLSG